MDDSGVMVHTKRGNEFLKQASNENGFYDRAVQEFVLAYKHALLNNKGKGIETSCLFNLGAAYVASGSLDRGIDVLSSVLDSISPTPIENDGENLGTIKRGDVLFNIGLGYEKKELYDVAIRYYETAMADYRLDPQCSTLLCETMEKLAKIYLAQDNYIKSRGLLHEASTEYLKKDMYEKACYVMINEIDAMLGDSPVINQGCYSLLEDCHEHSAKVKDPVRKCKLLMELGLKFSLICRFDDAVDCFEIILQWTTDQHLVAVAVQNLGVATSRAGNYERAIAFYQKATKLHGELGNRNAQGQCFCDLAFLLSRVQSYESASEAFIHALQAYKDSGDNAGQWQVHEGLAGVYIIYGRFRKAVKHYQLAIKFQALSKNWNQAVQDRLVQNLSRALAYQLHTSLDRQLPALESAPSHMKNSVTISSQSNYLPANENVVEEDMAPMETNINRPTQQRSDYTGGRRDYGADGRPLHIVNRGLSSFSNRDLPSRIGRYDDDLLSSSSDESSNLPHIASGLPMISRNAGRQGSRRRSRSNIAHGLIEEEPEDSNQPMKVDDLTTDDKLPLDSSYGEINNANDSGTEYDKLYRKQLENLDGSLTNVSNLSEEELPKPLPRTTGSDIPGPMTPTPPKQPPMKPPRTFNATNLKSPKKSLRFADSEHIYASIKTNGENTVWTKGDADSVTEKDGKAPKNRDHEGNSPDKMGQEGNSEDDAPPLSSIYDVVATGKPDDLGTIRPEDTLSIPIPSEEKKKKGSRACIVM